MELDWPWFEPGRDLVETPQSGNWGRIVACLNVWNDVDELKANWGTWYPHVDHVIAVDGAYAGTEAEILTSTDGTLEFLAEFDNVTVVSCPETDQRQKRSQYFKHGKPGDLLFVVDADEFFQNAAAIRETPDCDVGWMAYRSPVYSRAQHTPRLFRWRPGMRYSGRHHWVFVDDIPLSTHQQGGAGWEHRLIDVSFYNSRGVHRTEGRKRAASSARMNQVEEEFQVGERIVAYDPLRILQTGPFDPGNVIYRLHSAINTTTPHVSAMATGVMGPFDPPRQYGFDDPIVRDLVGTADVMHYHVMRVADKYVKMAPPATRVMHHHGTEYRRDPVTWNERDADVGLRLVSNLELLQYGENLVYLPNPMPVSRYRKMWAPFGKQFRIAHTPSKPGLKGTEVLLKAVEGLKNVEVVLVTGKSLAESLWVKSTCDACFDSFWLGMQCSGLEAGAMGMPVLAGDSDCKREYEDRFGAVPYTWVTHETLRETVERLVNDSDFYWQEAGRVSAFIDEHHDYPVVAQQYFAALQNAVNWRVPV